MNTSGIKRVAAAAVLAGMLGGCMQAAPAEHRSSNDAPVAAIEAPSEGLAVSDGYSTAYELDGYGIEEPVSFNTEEYDRIDEGGFVLASTRPLSTVSADVDTASYSNLKRLVSEAGPAQVPAGAVRIEEMLNYFDYGYDAPSDGSAFALNAHLGACPWNDKTELLVLGFSAAPEDTASLKGRNLVFLIDVSGSMDSEDKLGLLKKSFEKLVLQLDENDRVSIVTYASEERVVLDGVSGADHDRILAAIYSLYADGATAGERGLAMAYELAEKNFIDGGVNRVVMASDGDLNVGMSSVSDLHDFVSAKRGTGVYLSVLGFGSGNYKDNKMETLADDGNGSYHYIVDVAEAERVFGEKLCANLVPFADDVKLQVEFNPAQVKAYRLIGYENRGLADEDFRNDEADAGDVGPGAQFSVAYELVREGSDFDIQSPELKYSERTAAGGSELLTATLRYRSFDDGATHEQQLSVDGSDLASDPGCDWRFQAAVIEYGMLLRRSEFAGTSSYQGIEELLEDSAGDELRAEFAALARRSELMGHLEKERE